MNQPEGFVVAGEEKKVCKLVKSLYGLKQAPMQWHEKFDSVIISNGFYINKGDKCVYIKVVGDTCVILCLYVDDILIFGSNIHVINDTKKFLSNHFDMKDLGAVDVILGIKIIRNENSISLSQSHYIEKLLDKFNYSSVNPVSTPYDPTFKLRKNKGASVSQHKYSQIIGSLLHLMNHTRLDIAYTVGRLARYTHSPNTSHWDALERLFKYLKGTIDYAINFSGFPDVLEGYSDANWITDSEETKSTSGYVFTLACGAISWKSAKQTVISRSTMEAELIALDASCTEVEWLKSFLNDIPLLPKSIPPISLHCDNQVVIARAKSKNYNEKKRYLTVRHKSIRHLISHGVISLDFFRSENNIVDPLTKGLARQQVLQSSRGMGLKPIN
ncbi:hypothetical protein DH2020_021529 [Rehmannia glutinosa]|uniref:Reverse transcriptase Ty1/copia-type domain-containing protein n=1 Tax=Rehmannia glutinosa TaxID=99300 RepID=A0ABR0WF52_REHGL